MNLALLGSFNAAFTALIFAGHLSASSAANQNPENGSKMIEQKSAPANTWNAKERFPPHERSKTKMYRQKQNIQNAASIKKLENSEEKDTQQSNELQIKVVDSAADASRSENTASKKHLPFKPAKNSQQSNKQTSDDPVMPKSTRISVYEQKRSINNVPTQSFPVKPEPTLTTTVEILRNPSLHNENSKIPRQSVPAHHTKPNSATTAKMYRPKESSMPISNQPATFNNDKYAKTRDCDSEKLEPGSSQNYGSMQSARTKNDGSKKLFQPYPSKQPSLERITFNESSSFLPKVPNILDLKYHVDKAAQEKTSKQKNQTRNQLQTSTPGNDCKESKDPLKLSPREQNMNIITGNSSSECLRTTGEPSASLPVIESKTPITGVPIKENQKSFKGISDRVAIKETSSDSKMVQSQSNSNNERWKLASYTNFYQKRDAGYKLLSAESSKDLEDQNLMQEPLSDENDDFIMNLSNTKTNARLDLDINSIIREFLDMYIIGMFVPQSNRRQSRFGFILDSSEEDEHEDDRPVNPKLDVSTEPRMEEIFQAFQNDPKNRSYQNDADKWLQLFNIDSSKSSNILVPRPNSTFNTETLMPTLSTYRFSQVIIDYDDLHLESSKIDDIGKFFEFYKSIEVRNSQVVGMILLKQYMRITDEYLKHSLQELYNLNISFGKLFPQSRDDNNHMGTVSEIFLKYIQPFAFCTISHKRWFIQWSGFLRVYLFSPRRGVMLLSNRKCEFKPLPGEVVSEKKGGAMNDIFWTSLPIASQHDFIFITMSDLDFWVYSNYLVDIRPFIGGTDEIDEAKMKKINEKITYVLSKITNASMARLFPNQI